MRKTFTTDNQRRFTETFPFWQTHKHTPPADFHTGAVPLIIDSKATITSILRLSLGAFNATHINTHTH